MMHRPLPSRGLEEFFTNQQPGRTGRYWRLGELRLKSFEDLRKLWFVLLKERNMLHTYRFAAQRAGVFMKNYERVWKVRVSMRNIKKIVGEREREHKMLTEPEYVKAREARLEKTRERKYLYEQKGRRRAIGKFRNQKNEPIAGLFKLKPRAADEPYDPVGGMKHAIYDKMGRKVAAPKPAAALSKRRLAGRQRIFDLVAGLNPSTTASSTASTSGAAAVTADFDGKTSARS